jgi:two-component system, OmpR family, phosphate regulon sensor histidine kinase PhoR
LALGGRLLDSPGVGRVFRRRPPPQDASAGTAGAAAGNLPDARLTLLEHAEEGMLLVRRDTVQWGNSTARLMFPTFESPINRPLVEVVRDYRIEAQVKNVERSGVEQSIEIELPISGRRLLVRAIPVSDAVGLVIQDVTRLRQLQTVRQEFVANLSHEMRTPLAGLDLAAQTLSEQLAKSGDARLFIDRIMAESQRLQGILRNLNQLAALDAESIPIDRRPLRAAELVGELVERFRLRASTAGLSLRADPIDDELVILGDRAKTDQALQNLMDNAIKFTKSGEVTVAARGDDQRVEITVRDTGIGIPPGDLPRIFERFYKVDRARGGQPGSGLGLSIARHLIELQGGTIGAESTPGTGTTVRIRLPRALLTSP